VDGALFHRLRPGSRVAIRYTTLPVVEGVIGIGSFLADSTWASRTPGEMYSGSLYEGVAALIAYAWLAFVAYRKQSGPLAWIAALLGGALVSSLGLGLFVFPALLFLWIAKRRQAFAWLFLATLALTVALLDWRIPKSAPLPAGPTRQADAIVRRIHLVDKIWKDDEGGQPIKHPFLMLDLEYTPVGSNEPFHVLDRIDRGSVPGLIENGTVRILYSPADPGAGLIVGATRDYSRAILVELLSDTFVYGAAMALLFGVIFVIGAIGRRLFARLTVPDEALKRVSALPLDHPGRKALDAVLRDDARESGSLEDKS